MRIKKIFSAIILASVILSSCKNVASNRFSFHYSQSTTYDYQDETFYDDSYFYDDSTIYNNSLSTCSMTFALASFASNVNKENESYRYRNGEEFLKNAGFTDIDVNSYYKVKTTTDSLGLIFGHKKIKDTTLIAVGIRGGNYEMEWAGNFTLGDGKEIIQHKGFYDASTIYLNSLEEYISKYSLSGEVKLWTVGYSRGGASNNLAVGRIDQKIAKNETLFNGLVSLKKENIYCYCFEPPMGASFNEEISPRDEIYSNIHNIVNANDPVPKVAMKELRFTRYGVDYFLPDSVRNLNYTSLINPVIKFFNSVDNHSVLGDYAISNFILSSNKSSSKEYTISSFGSNRLNWTSGLFLDEFLSSLTILGVQSLDNYVDNFQSGLREIFEVVYKNGSPKFSFMTLGVSFAKYILNSTNIDLLINNLVHNSSVFVKDFIVLLNTVLKSLGVEISPVTLLNCIMSLVGALAKVLIQNISFFFTLLSTDNIKAIASGHYPELCLSHLRAQDKNYTSNVTSYNSDGSYYYLEIPDVNEDTTIEIIDSKGKTVGKLKDSTFDKEGTITYGSKGKTFFAYLPVEHSYQIKMTKIDSYSLSYFDQRQENLVKYKEESDLSDNEITLKTETYPEKK